MDLLSYKNYEKDKILKIIDFMISEKLVRACNRRIYFLKVETQTVLVLEVSYLKIVFIDGRKRGSKSLVLKPLWIYVKSLI